MDIIIRKENEDEYRAVEELTREAFWNLYFPGCDEHYTAHQLRTHPDYLPELSFVAEYEKKLIGMIMYSRSFVKGPRGEKLETVTFGPVCVLPEYQHKGVGTKLINHTIEMAGDNGVNAIIILGNPHNYCRYGFRNSRDYQITDSNGRYPFGQLVLELKKGIFEGRKWSFHYSPAFEFDSKEAEQFDTLFPAKKKEKKASQVEFSIDIRAYLD